MSGKFEFKVCGVRRREDVAKSIASGASYLGFNFYPKSPRFIELDGFKVIADAAPAGSRVAVLVNPELGELERLKEAGLDFFQIHFPQSEGMLETVAAWSKAVGPARLWLAPKMPPGSGFDERLLPFADTFLWDAYQADAFGGTGKVSDWAGLAAISKAHPDKNWVLAGGLNPANAAAAIEATGVRCLDFNSGVEISPAVKDLAALERVGALVHSLNAS